MVASRDWDPAATSAFVSSAGRGSWDPDLPAALGSSIGRGSRDFDPSVEELRSACRVCGSARSATSIMLMTSEVAAM
jgi:hypothetical protein